MYEYVAFDAGCKKKFGPMIKVSRLNYEYPGKRALKDVSFEIPEGSITALVGPNGAGKTTLLRCIAAIDEPFSGQIEVAGINVADEPRNVHRVLGYLSDFFGLYNELTVKQCLTFAAWLHKWPQGDVEQQVLKTAALLGLTPWLANKAQTLSRGWRQRLGIAQAIIHQPRLLLLDEPASGLDPEARFELSGLFRNLQGQGMTLMISSHILSELEDYCTDMLVLRDGEVSVHQRTASAQQQELVVQITFAGDAERFLPMIGETPGVINLTHEKGIVRFRCDGGEEKPQAIIRQIMHAGANIKSFNIGTDSLQDIYLSLPPKKETGDAKKS